jgi:MFS family permease
VTYLGELRVNWRFLTSATLGLGFGYGITSYLNNIFTPHLLNAFGWTKAQVSVAGSVLLLSVICMPITGRIADAVGTRRMATIGVISMPLFFVGFSAMTGDFRQYVWLSIAQIIMAGMTTTMIVYSRLIAAEFKNTRGIGVAIAASAPPILGAALAPLLSNFIDAHGWRTGYIAVAVATGIGGLLALLFMPRKQEDAQTAKPARRPAVEEYMAILRSPAFLIIIGGVLLCYLPQIMQTTQLTVILLERDVSSEAAALMLSGFAIGVVAGRFMCGTCLDRFPTHIVAAIAVGLPAAGMVILASGLRAPTLLAMAVALLGLAKGAEISVMPYLCMRFFRREIYSSVLGLMNAGIGASSTIGALILGLTLKLTGSFTPFMLICAGVSVVAAAGTLLLGQASIRDSVT